MTTDTVGLHGPVYVAASLLEEARGELEKLAIRASLGDKVGAVEKIGLLLLAANGHVPRVLA